jgi:GDPmannose 4,6-dehydratase
MWMMLQQEKPQDYVIATGVTHSARQLLEVAFGHLGLDYREYVETDPAFLRPAEVYHLRGDYAKAARELGWKPTVTFEELVKMMVDADMARVRKALANTSVGETVP